MNNEIKTLQAILLMAETLNYSSTYKLALIEEVTLLIKKAKQIK